MKTFLFILLLQSIPLPPRVALENPSQVSQVPQKAKKDYDKLWSTFVAGQHATLSKDLERFLKKQKTVDAALVLKAYTALYRQQEVDAVQSFQQVLLLNPNNRIALYYLAELAFAHEEYRQASTLYSRLIAV